MLQTVANHCTQLREVQLPPTVTNATLQVLAENCSELTTLNISACYLITVEGLQIVSQHCKKLRHLFMGPCHCIGACLGKIEYVARKFNKEVLLHYGQSETLLGSVTANQMLSGFTLFRVVCVDDLHVTFAINREEQEEVGEIMQ